MSVLFVNIVLGIAGFLSLMSAIAPAAFAEEPLRIRTYYIDFKPTLVPDKRVEEIVIKDLVGQGAFKIVRNVRPPFRLVTPEADLVVRNNELLIKAEFAPISGGGFTDDLLLARIGTPGFDTLRIRMTATAYYIDRKEALEFGRVLLGDTVKRRLYIRNDNTGEQTWLVVPQTRPTPPFSLRSNIPTNIPTTDTSFFLFEFAPTIVGVFKDTVSLVRIHKGIALDTIRVFLSGVGIDLDTTVQLNFGTVLTFDSVARRRAFYKPLAQVYRVKQKPDANSAFMLQMSEKNDSILTSISFAPTTVGQHADTIILERVREISAPLPYDRIVVHLTGSGAAMPDNGIVGFIDAKVNDVLNKSLTVRLDPAPLAVEFVYELLRIDEGPVSGIITEPTGVSKAASITAEFLCAPTVFVASSTQKFILIRSTEARKPIDSTLITASVQMVPRPVSLSLKMEQDTTHMRIGDTATLRVLIVAEGDIDEPMRVESATGRIGYNASVVVPQLSDEWIRAFDDDDVYVQYTATANNNIVIEGPTTVVAELSIIGVLGDADRTTLEFRDWVFNINAKRVDASASDALVLLTNLWQYSNGNVRLVNSLQGTLVLAIDPNPVIGTSTLTVSNVPNGVGELVIVDSHGALVSDLTPQLRLGTREFPISKGTGGGIVLSPGSYYARLLVRGSNGQSVNSIARLFVVQ